MPFDPARHYTADEWSFIVEPFDWNWPEDWRARRDEVAAFEPQLRAICARHGLAFGPHERAFGSHAVFLFDDFVIKLYARYSPVWYRREVEALEVVARSRDAHSPRLLGHDDCDLGRAGHAYIAMQRLPGEPWITLRENGTPGEKLAAVEQMARAVRAIHAIDPTELKSFRCDPEEWVAALRARAALAPEYMARALPERLARQVAPYLAEHLDAITPDFTPRLLSTDVNSFNSLFLRRDGAIALSGQIDFGDMEVGPLEYEWPSVVQKALRHDRALVERFFTAYGIALPFSDESLRRLKILSLLHRFPTVASFAEQHPAVTSLDDLLTLQWSAVSAIRPS